MSDEDVMEQLGNGYPDALPMLFDRFHRLVLKIALRILRDPGEAEDVMQEVFLEIFNRAAQFDPAKGSAKTWILQYAYHRSLSRRQYLALRNFYDRRRTGERKFSGSCSLDLSWRGLCRTVCNGSSRPARIQWRTAMARRARSQSLRSAPAGFSLYL